MTNVGVRPDEDRQMRAGREDFPVSYLLTTAGAVLWFLRRAIALAISLPFILNVLRLSFRTDNAPQQEWEPEYEKLRKDCGSPKRAHATSPQGWWTVGPQG
jgi:hypothetical protein